jgi:vacuolar-type H+-ATPase subunit E/Vma4
MTFNTEKAELTREQQLQSLQAKINDIFAEAIKNKISLEVFAVDIWVNAVRQEAPYVAIASRMINLATGLIEDENLAFLRFLAKETLAQNLAKSQWAVQLIYNGLVINNRS